MAYYARKFDLQEPDVGKSCCTSLLADSRDPPYEYTTTSRRSSTVDISHSSSAARRVERGWYDAGLVLI